MKSALNYDKMVLLDAETLAEAGIKDAYQSIAKVLAQYVREPAQLQEVVDNDAPSYAVRIGDTEYVIYAPLYLMKKDRVGEERRTLFSRSSMINWRDQIIASTR